MEAYRANGRIDGPFDPRVSAKCVNGTFVGLQSDGVVAFRGIPFAAPPTGPRRWREPVPAEASDGVFEAYYNGPSPIQTKLESERASYYRQSEDCLYLNVWTASGYEGEKRPVMVFIHGGSYGWGGTADPLYDGHNFVKSSPEVVLVTVAYRTGIAGFIDFSGVPGGKDYRASGNLGILDQICALRYVRDNISAFGGDPGCVTVFGESAGGGSVSLLPLIPAARGLFRRVIAESGSVALTYSRKECGKLTKLLLKETGARGMKDLAAMSEEEFMRVNEKLNIYANFPERDGVVIPEDPYAAYERGAAFPVDMMIGTNADELRYWILDLGDLGKYRRMSALMIAAALNDFKPDDRRRAIEFLSKPHGSGPDTLLWRVTEFFNEILFRQPAVRQATAHASHGNPTYTYYWKQPSAIPDLLACHAVELSYVFGNLDDTVYTGQRADEELSDKVRRMWVNFAVSGDPSIPGIKWERYGKAGATMILGKKPETVTGFGREEEKLLLPLTDYRINGNFSAVVASVVSLAAKAAGAVAVIGAAAVLLKKLMKKK